MPEHNEQNVNKLINDLLWSWDDAEVNGFVSEKLHEEMDDDPDAFNKRWETAIEQGYLVMDGEDGDGEESTNIDRR